MPVYEIAQDGRCGSQVLDLGGSRLFLAEGIFAQEIVPACRTAASSRRRTASASTASSRSGGGSPATCASTASRRSSCVRRGLALLRDQRRVVAHAVDLGCEPVSPEEAYREVSALVSRSSADA